MANASARVVVLMSPDEKDELTLRASRAGVSVGEFVRRSVWEAITDQQLEAELEARRDEIEPLLDELERRNAEALASMDATIANLDRVLSELGTRRAEDELERSDLGQHPDDHAHPREAERPQ
jgi:hypothetical protein